MSTPEPCNSDIYNNGTVAGIMAGKTSQDIEAYVQALAEKTGQRVDWHFVGGRAVVKVLGDVELVRKAMTENQEEGFQFLIY